MAGLPATPSTSGRGHREVEAPGSSRKDVNGSRKAALRSDSSASSGGAAPRTTVSGVSVLDGFSSSRTAARPAAESGGGGLCGCFGDGPPPVSKETLTESFCEAAYCGDAAALRASRCLKDSPNTRRLVRSRSRRARPAVLPPRVRSAGCVQCVQ